ncbi:hypothetical protein COLO4_03338 [Corchorus olitorius]|uniref:PGG domain-containing protein n=1 Tax=Corchorus olitorius TaxID=93759 RepID=A0A1R3KYW8_9ROSI|nr:hypothetical protein COLO4_03338 [Corchorus olitorius]
MGLLGPIMNMSPERINTLLVGLTLIITAIYSAILNPPGGVWQGDAGEPGVGNSVMDPVTFQAFFAVNYAVYIFAAFSVVVLIQVVTSSAAIGIMAEILAALFTCSFVGAWLVIVPENADFFIDILHLPNLSRALELKLGPLYFLFLLASMEGCRRLCLMFKRWYDQV